MFPFSRYRQRSQEQLILEYVLKPLTEAYNISKENKEMGDYDENTITKKLVWYLKHETSVSYAYQRKTICIEMRPKEQYTIEDTYEPDIKFMLRDRPFWIEIESKRIYDKNNWSISEYLSRERGIGRFLWGTYSQNENYGGMIGYIQKGDFIKIVQGIRIGLGEINCKKCEDMTKIENCVLSVHYRSNKEDIRIYHLFFYFS